MENYTNQIEELELSYEELNENLVEEEIAGTYSAEEAILMSKERFKGIDFEYIMGLCGLSFDELIEQTGGKYIWQNPVLYAMTEDERDGWQLPEEYFVGNPVRLLEEAKEMHSLYGRFEANIEELQRRMPARKSIDHVKFVPGNPVLSEEIHARYIKERKKLDVLPKVVNMGRKWIIHNPNVKKSLDHKTPFETAYMDFYTLMQHLMNSNLFEANVNGKGKDKEKISGEEKKERLLIVQELGNLVIEDFNNWVHSTEDVREEAEESYYRKYSFIQPEYDVNLLKMKDLNPEIQLYHHQQVGILRMLLGEALLLNHSTGAGKTLTMTCGAYEAKRLEMTEKTLIVTPEESFQEFVKTFACAYPHAKIFAIHPKKDFAKKKQKQTIRKIKNEDYTAIIMADSSFNLIDMSNEYYLRKKEREIRTCKRELEAAEKRSLEEQVLKRRLNALEKQLDKLKREWKLSSACFEELGITMLMIDESHHYKNISLDSRLNIVGHHSKGSEKSDSLLEKVHHVLKQKGKVVFATGTPLSNSLSDLYVLQKYLQPNELEFCGISKFSMWANSFAQSETTFDLDLMLNPRFITRFTSFYNLTELRGLFGKVCDTYYANKDELNLPEFQGHINVVVKKSQEQKDYDKEILERLENIRLKLVGRRQDNHLLVTMDARNASTDIRLVKKGMDDQVTYSKASVCAEKMKEFYDQYPGTTQIAFCDCSTPKSTFNIYDELRKQLELLGIPAEEIAYIHDGSTETKRKKLLADFNKGKIRIMIGSTKKLGTGVNVQENLIALHHIDVPWRPADFTQREGRIIRQGNQNKEVFILRYITENSFDAYMWQLIESKQKFINCFLAGELDPEEYDVSDISDIILSYAEAKALAIGNPLIKTRVETSNEIERLRILQRKRRRELYDLQTFMGEAPEKESKLRKLVAQMDADITWYQKKKESINMDEREGFGEELLEELYRNRMQPEERVFDIYQGFEVVLPKHMSLERPYVILRREDGGSYYIKMDGDKALGCSRRLDYFLEHLPERRKQHADELRVLKQNYKHAKEEIEKGNTYDQALLEAVELLASIDKELNAA